MIFVCGIHEIGKKYYCEKISEELKIPYFAVGDWREDRGLLIEEVQRIRQKTNRFILEGRLCLLDAKGKIKKVPIEIFRKMGIDSLVVVIEGIQEIQKNFQIKNGGKWGNEFLEILQNEEIKYAKKLASQLKIDLKIAKVDNSTDHQFNKNIVLPIKPIYAEKILNNTKKYEFRKKICSDNIDKIYLYATVPVKGIVGEAMVNEKIIMNKERMWGLVKEKSGITFSYFDQYYRNNENACAYVLGKVKRYDRLVPLEEVGVLSVPQSYVYVGD